VTHYSPIAIGIALVTAVGSSSAASFTDVFDTHPGEIGRKPFMWWVSAEAPSAAASWELVDGTLQYRAENAALREALIGHWDAGVSITDASSWTVETGFRHVSGAGPISQYEAVVYICWQSDQPHHIGLLSLCYDAPRKQLDFLNGDGKHEPIPADLSGPFHPVRITVAEREVRVYLEGKLVSGPHPVGSLKWEAPPRFIIGPITRTQPHTLCCRWDYFAFTDEGAFAPTDDSDWDPSAATGPVSVPIVDNAPAPKDPAAGFRHPPYPGITLLRREPGSRAYERALPDQVHLWRKATADKPRNMPVPFYTYADAEGPTVQNVYWDCIPLKTDDSRCVAVFHMTRGMGDTVFGFSDYKLWYSVSTDGGESWDAERPLVQQGEGYSPTHPVEQVWIGKNSFVFATLPSFIYPMSNGRLLLPCYYLPLDEEGRPRNPFNTSTFSQVFCLIGTWNASREDVLWDATKPITLATDQSPSGISECAVIELRDKPGHILMVIRAGNEGDRTRTVPSWKWQTLSTDYGRTWSSLTPFTYSDGTKFFSPTSQSNFIRSSRTGKVYWIGNISTIRPKSGWPRYPLVMAELDEETMGLRKETVTTIDNRGPEDGANMQLSNFGFAEDPATGHIVIRLNRLNGAPGASGPHTYTVQVR